MDDQQIRQLAAEIAEEALLRRARLGPPQSISAEDYERVRAELERIAEHIAADATGVAGR